MRRGRPLRPDPDRVRAWLRRSRERQDLARRAPLRPARRRRKARLAPEQRAEVLARSGGLCVRPGCRRRAAHLHHVLPEHLFPEVAADPDNRVGVCPACHDGHERAAARLPLACLPRCALELAARVSPAAEAYVQRIYPREGTDAGRHPARGKGGADGERSARPW